MPLFLLESDEPLPRLRIAASDPSWVLIELPDCGCDACDYGSADLLEAIDERITSFLVGPYVLMRGPAWRSVWWPGGGEAGGEPGLPKFDELMETSRRIAAGERVAIPDGAKVLVSRSWLS